MVEEKRAFDATIKGVATPWEVNVWDAVEQVSKHSLSSPSSQKRVTQILIANLRWIKDFSPSKKTQKVLQKYEQLLTTMILALNSPSLQKDQARMVFSRLSSTLDALLSKAAPSTDEDVAFIDRVKQQASVIHRQLDNLVGTERASDVEDEDDLTSNFLALTLDSIMAPVPDAKKKATQSKSELEQPKSDESKSDEGFSMSLLPCLLDYFQEHPNQFPVTTQRNARTFVKHVLKAEYGITQTQIARAIKYSDASVSRWLSGKGQDQTVGEKVIQWINGPYQQWLLGIEHVEPSSQPCIVRAKIPEVNQLMIDINEAMYRWLRENADVSSVEVGLNVNKQVTIAINCDRTAESFMDPHNPTLPQIVLDHADVVVLIVRKRAEAVLCTKIVQAKVAKRHINEQAAKEANETIGFLKQVTQSLQQPLTMQASIGAYFYTTTPTPNHLLTSTFHGSFEKFTKVALLSSPGLNLGPLLFDLSNELQELSGVTVTFNPLTCVASTHIAPPRVRVELFASSEPVRGGTELAMIIAPSAVVHDCTLSVRIIGEIHPVLFNGQSNRGKRHKNLLQIKNLRSLLGHPQQSEQGWSGSRVYTQSGLLGFLIGSPEADTNSALVSYWNQTEYVEMKDYVLCQHNDNDKTFIDQLKDLMQEQRAGYGGIFPQPPNIPLLQQMAAVAARAQG